MQSRMKKKGKFEWHYLR
uniref:Uncharacterized protein n=1 Tax=Arundo donax TaxID=35708 RepID=A0A0A9EYQ3_ARUDO